MTRPEWLSIIIMLGSILFVLIMILVYIRFMWNMQCKQWDMLCAKDLAYDTETKLFMGNVKSREFGIRERGMLGGEDTGLFPGSGDGGKRGPRLR